MRTRSVIGMVGLAIVVATGEAAAAVPAAPGLSQPGISAGNHEDLLIAAGATAADPETMTPEPVSMALLAAGLAGLSGIQLRRRRQQ